MDKLFVPDEFYCPISGELMDDPLESPGGHSYERKQILRWIEIKNTSPMTRDVLNKSDLKENKTLKKCIESMRDKVTEDQLKIKTKISNEELKCFTNSLDDIDVKSYYLDNKLLVNINVPDVEIRPPIDIVLCIDISYSMGESATIKGDQNETINYGISILSLTVTAAKSILRSLNDNDNISIVTYSADADVLFDHIQCSLLNKKLIEAQLDQLKPTANTNMWSGIQSSLDILRTKSPKNRNKGILLLTDGIPNVEPPRGHEETLQRYFKQYDFQCMVNCYGFGYNLNSNLLLNISNLSGGDGFSFIPDASLLGNTFIHGISNMLITASYRPKVNISLLNGIKFPDNSTELQLELDSLKYGKEKNLYFNIDTSELKGHEVSNSISVSLTLNEGHHFHVTQTTRPSKDYLYEQVYRIKTINIINQCIQKIKFCDDSYKRILNELILEMESIVASNSNQYIENILYDLNWQVKESLNMTSKGNQENWFDRWGKHYLRSLQNAYKNEICNNFKDKGVSNFASGVFNNLREEISNIFDTLPPPKKDISQQKTTTSNTVTRPVPQTMQVYNNAGGGCCAKGCRILVGTNTYKKVEDIRKGDTIKTHSLKINDNGVCNVLFENSKIECVIETVCDNNHESMVTINNLKITPYHPIIPMDKHYNGWMFPIMQSKPITIPCEKMYTFIVENRQSVIIENFVFATYGHNLSGEIISHNYFGSEKVIDDLKEYETYNDGIVSLTKDMFHRGNDNTVSKIAP